MTLNQITYFVTVAKYENYHQAAEELYISQPSLSRSMAALEEELGVMLFEKAGRGIALTKAGKLFMEHAETILKDCEIATEKMKDLSKTGGKIDIGYVFSLANKYMPHKVRSFLNIEGNKNVTFNFSQGYSAQIIEMVKSGQIDIAFCAYVEHEEDLEFFPILDQEIVIIVPINHPLAAYDDVSIMELLNYPVISYDKSSGLGNFCEGVFRRLHIQPEIAFQCPDENSIQALVVEDFGIAMTAKVDFFDETRLKVLHINDAALSHKVFMAWQKDRYQLPAVNNFITYMKEQSDFVD